MRALVAWGVSVIVVGNATIIYSLIYIIPMIRDGFCDFFNCTIRTPDEMLVVWLIMFTVSVVLCSLIWAVDWIIRKHQKKKGGAE